MSTEIPRLTEDQIQQTVHGLVAGRIYTATMVPEHLLGMVFMPLGLGGMADLDWDNVGNIIGDLNEAMDRSINGFPIFTKCRVVHNDDWTVIVERTEQAAAALKQAVEGTQ